MVRRLEDAALEGGWESVEGGKAGDVFVEGVCFGWGEGAVIGGFYEEVVFGEGAFPGAEDFAADGEGALIGDGWEVARV